MLHNFFQFSKCKDFFDADFKAQQYMENCVLSGRQENDCRLEAIETYGSAGYTRIEIYLQNGIDDIDPEELSRNRHGLRDVRSIPMTLKNFCNESNTVYFGGMCHCRIGYAYGNPKVGCWKCSPKCHERALCTRNNGCICENWTIGDGVRDCQTHVPHIQSAEVLSDKRTVLVTVDPVQWPIPHSAYCRFNNFIVEGSLISNKTIECVRATEISENSHVDVSWDKNIWTHQRCIVTESQDVTSSLAIIISLIFVTVFFGIYGLYLYIIGKKRMKKLESYIRNVDQMGHL